MAAAPPSSSKIDRHTTTPFLLKLFYRNASFHRLDEFFPGASSSSLPPHLQIYTWQTCSLRELTHLLTSALPNILPSPAVGTRIAFRLVFPDTRGSMISPNQPGRFLTKDLGSVVVGAESSANGTANGFTGISGNLEGEADKTLQDARFVIGDYISCAVIPPLSNGSIAPAPAASSHTGRGGYGGGGPPRGTYMDNQGYRGRGGRGLAGPSSGLPSGEWRRGERIPDEPRYGSGRGRSGRGP